MIFSNEAVIIIPVYNGFEESLSCLISVLEHTPRDQMIVVLDDASPKGEFLNYLSKEILANQNLVIKRFKENGGYVRAVNYGMRYAENIVLDSNYLVSVNTSTLEHGRQDLILLNSDTLVTKNWTIKLKQAAYSQNQIATVTPYSNNAILASFPRFCRPSKISMDQIEKLASQIERYSKKTYPDLATSMGFCNYIPRKALDTIGYYNEEAFGLGNGEENDFSMRAEKLGFRNILDDATYIFHVGEVSFAERKKDFENKNGEILNQLHPEYLPKISNFCSRDPNRKIRMDTLDAIFLEQEEKPRVLHILHNGPFFSRNIERLGGTELHVQDLITSINSCAHWSLVADANRYYLTAYFSEVEREYAFDRSKVGLFDILKPEFFNLIHYHHGLTFDRNELIMALKGHGNYIVAMHDFNLICPRNILITPKSKLCNTKECLTSCGYFDSYMAELRGLTLALLNRARKVVYFSESTEKIFKQVLDLKADSVKIWHGVKSNINKVNYKPIITTLDVLILGVLAPHKGADIIDSFRDKLVLPSGIKIQFHLLGVVQGDKSFEHIIEYGSYDRDSVSQRICQINPHLVFLPSICAETYSLTLDEALACGLPAVVGPNGAPAERVKEQKVGWVLESLSVENALELFVQITSNSEEYLEKFNTTNKLKFFTQADESDTYEKMYLKFINKKKRQLQNQAFQQILINFESLKINKKSRLFSLILKLINKTTKILDKLGIRKYIQLVIFSIIPKSFLYKLKVSKN